MILWSVLHYTGGVLAHVRDMRIPPKTPLNPPRIYIITDYMLYSITVVIILLMITECYRYTSEFFCH